MKTSQVIKCPHYEGDGYRYNLNRIEFLFCESCNNGLLSQMIEQKKLEEQLNSQSMSQEYLNNGTHNKKRFR